MAARDSAEQAKDMQHQAAAQSVERLSKCAQRLQTQAFALLMVFRHTMAQHEACEKADTVHLTIQVQYNSDNF